jgi:hypothetical protein
MVGRDTELQDGKSRARFPVGFLEIFNWPNTLSHLIALGSTQPITEMSTKKFPSG